MPPLRGYAGVAGDVRQAERRRRLIEAAVELLADSGAAAVTVSGVCRQAGLTARYFYEHFAGRDALLEAMVDAEADSIIAVAQTATVQAVGSPRERGAAGVGALLTFLESDPRAVRITRERGQDEIVLRMRAALTERLTDALIRDAELMWPAARSADTGRVALTAAMVMGGVVQLLVAWLEGTSRLTRDELVRIIAEFTVNTGELMLSAGAAPAARRP